MSKTMRRMLVGCAAAVLAPAVLAAAAGAGSAPTFSKDVAAILFAHCTNCHREGEIGAAVPLLSYAAVKSRAESIKAQVASRAMPPWPADPERSVKLRNDARLPQRDIDTVIAWVDAGAPRGNDAELPPPPAPPPKWLHPQGRPPDAVLSLPEVAVSASGEIPYLQQRVKVPLVEDKWIAAMQVNPGNTALVHHMGITEVTMAEGMGPEDLDALAKVARQMGAADDALMHIRPAVLDPLNGQAYDMLGVYTPGTTFEMYGNDSAKLLKGGKNLYINFNIHYTTTGKPEKNHSELALWFQTQPPAHQLIRAPIAVTTIIANGRELLSDDPGTKAEGTDVAIPPIPPNADNYELIGMTAFTSPVTLYQLQPHAHMRGKDFTYTVVYPDGREDTVLSVPKYDFHWQLAYDLDTPLTLPAGSKLIVTAHYDNSSNNKHLREAGVDPRTCGPDKVAYFRRQNQSWHEMFSPLVQYSIDDAEDAKRGADDAKGNDSRPRLVETAGCIKRGGTNSWLLTAAGDPVAAQSQSSSSAELHGLNLRPGNRSYELLGARAFQPQIHDGHRVVVKGVLVGGTPQQRVNVTSLQAIAGTCP